MSNASKFERDYSRVSIALSLAKCSQTCTVYISSVEKTLNFVIQELDYQYLSMDQCNFHLSSIMGNAKPWTASPQEDGKPEDCKTYVWKEMVTSFNEKSLLEVS